MRLRDSTSRSSLSPILEGLMQLPPLDLEYGEETRLRLPSVYSGLSVALARSFIIVDPHLKHSQTQHWGTTFRLFDLAAMNVAAHTGAVFLAKSLI
jgi:hypothetical protein